MGREFPYLGSLIVESGRMYVDVDKRIENASKAFGALRRASCLQGCSFVGCHQEECVQSMCVVSAALRQ